MDFMSAGFLSALLVIIIIDFTLSWSFEMTH